MDDDLQKVRQQIRSMKPAQTPAVVRSCQECGSPLTVQGECTRYLWAMEELAEQDEFMRLQERNV